MTTYYAPRLPEGCPKRSPWGKVQSAELLQDGVWVVDTPGHGGVKCDRKANAKIPAVFRKPGGWYEEDCDVAIPMLFLNLYRDSEQADRCKNTLRDYYPDAYEKHFCVVLAPGESYKRDQQRFHEDNADKWIVTSAWGDWHALVPAGMVGVCAVQNGCHNNPRWFLVPKAEYDTRGKFSFVIDVEKHGPWCGPYAVTNFAK